jgi:hypothetical protein
MSKQKNKERLDGSVKTFFSYNELFFRLLNNHIVCMYYAYRVSDCLQSSSTQDLEFGMEGWMDGRINKEITSR